MSHGTQEVHALAHTDLGCDLLEPLLLGLISVLAVFAQDQEPDVVVGAVTQQSKGANRDLDPFQALEPAHEKEQPSRPVSNRSPGFGRVDRLEHRQVHTWRNDEDSRRICAISADQVCALLLSRCEQ